MAKGKYEYWLTPEGLLRLEAWARDGLVDEQIAENIGINPATLYDWKKKYPKISESLKRGKEVIDIQVENALLKRALGYAYEGIYQISTLGQVRSLDRMGAAVPEWLLGYLEKQTNAHLDDKTANTRNTRHQAPESPDMGDRITPWQKLRLNRLKAGSGALTGAAGGISVPTKPTRRISGVPSTAIGTCSTAMAACAPAGTAGTERSATRLTDSGTGIISTRPWADCWKGRAGIAGITARRKFGTLSVRMTL